LFEKYLMVDDYILVPDQIKNYYFNKPFTKSDAKPEKTLKLEVTVTFSVSFLATQLKKKKPFFKKKTLKKIFLTGGFFFFSYYDFF